MRFTAGADGKVKKLDASEEEVAEYFGAMSALHNNYVNIGNTMEDLESALEKKNMKQV